MFVDEAVIFCAAGRGGKGCSSLDRSNPRRPRATGGDGGDGGSVIIEAQPNIQTLLDFQMTREFHAENGGNGSSSNMRGYRGADLVLGVPPGTEILDRATGELLSDLDAVGARVTVCRGGAGGKGNDKRNDATPGDPGEAKDIFLRLKLIADVGLVGFPNAGKSTFISRVSNARSKVAAYPFTTKNPVLGVVKFDDDEVRVFADIPGLIEGAHEGRGLGVEFLKHIERTRLLLHLIDFAAFDGRDPVSDYRSLRNELGSYSDKLADKPEIVVANKIDVPEAKENLKRFRKAVKVEVFPISAATGEGIDALLKKVRSSF
ncbi:MAG TPA: Obg family GTPase CgtA [Candidatus Eisenbacteria bacterium]|nr:Obg family GTPase CgtA [Candidatus Eisenbacteria bacterium]